MKTIILTSSDCDMSYEIARRLHMRVAPLHIICPERDYIDGVDILPEAIYQCFSDEIPAISTPGPQDVEDMIEEIKAEGYTHVLTFCIFSGLSDTYNTIASVLGSEKNLASLALDIRDISLGAGILTVQARTQLEEGKGFDELREMLPGKVKDSRVFYYMDTLTYLRRGDRIGLVTSAVGNILNIKPAVSCNDDRVYYTTTKIRSAKQELPRLLAKASFFVNGYPCLTALLSGQEQGASDKLKSRLIAHIPEGHLIMEKVITTSLAVHTGPGLMGIGVPRL